jgi:hypothetical protein
VELGGLGSPLYQCANRRCASLHIIRFDVVAFFKALLAQDELNRQAAKQGAGGSAAAARSAAPVAAAAASAAPAAASAAAAVYTECRIQLRPPPGAGKAVAASFPATSTVGAIRDYAAANIPALANGVEFALVMTRPHK